MVTLHFVFQACSVGEQQECAWATRGCAEGFLSETLHTLRYSRSLHGEPGLEQERHCKREAEETDFFLSTACIFITKIKAGTQV